jgi:hypothetical protein
LFARAPMACAKIWSTLQKKTCLAFVLSKVEDADWETCSTVLNRILVREILSNQW